MQGIAVLFTGGRYNRAFIAVRQLGYDLGIYSAAIFTGVLVLAGSLTGRLPAVGKFPVVTRGL